MVAHRDDHKRYLAGKHNRRITSFEILQYDDAVIILIEDCSCENKEQLIRRERYWVENTPNCVNKCIPGRTFAEYYEANRAKILDHVKEYNDSNREKIAEYQKEYREINREKLVEYQKEYQKTQYAINRDTILARKKEKIQCECGLTLCKGNMSTHLKSKGHQKYIDMRKDDWLDELVAGL